MTRLDRARHAPAPRESRARLRLRPARKDSCPHAARSPHRAARGGKVLRNGNTSSGQAPCRSHLRVSCARCRRARRADRMRRAACGRQPGKYPEMSGKRSSSASGSVTTSSPDRTVSAACTAKPSPRSLSSAAHKRDEPPAFLAHLPHARRHCCGVHARVPHRHRAGKLDHLEREVFELHRIAHHPSRSAAPPAGTTPRGTAGCTSPSSSTIARCTNTGISAGGCGSRGSAGSPNTIGCTLPNIGGERDAERDQQQRRRPRLLVHRRREQHELAREHAERRHAEDREGAEHASPSRSRDCFRSARGCPP